LELLAAICLESTQASDVGARRGERQQRRRLWIDAPALARRALLIINLGDLRRAHWSGGGAFCEHAPPRARANSASCFFFCNPAGLARLVWSQVGRRGAAPVVEGRYLGWPSWAFDVATAGSGRRPQENTIAS
jgi:hypothetical protein